MAKSQKTTLGWVGGILAIVVTICVLIGYVMKAGGQVKTLETIDAAFTLHLEDQKKLVERQERKDKQQDDAVALFNEFLKDVDKDQAVTQAQLKDMKEQLERIEKWLEKLP